MPGKKYFLFLKDGTFAERVNSCPSPMAITSIHGHLLNVTFNSSPTGKIMKIHIANEKNFYMLSMYVNSRPAYAFLMLIGGLDLKLSLTLKVDKTTGKNIIKAYQNDKLVLWSMDSLGFETLLIQEKVAKLLDRLRSAILPAIEAIGNPFPYHEFYKPPKLTKSERLGIKYPVYGNRG